MNKVAAVICQDTVLSLSVLEYEERLWVVSGWTEAGERDRFRPQRLFRMSDCELEPVSNGDYDYFVHRPVSSTLLSGGLHPEAAEGFIVVDLPSLTMKLAHRKQAYTWDSLQPLVC